MDNPPTHMMMKQRKNPIQPEYIFAILGLLTVIGFTQGLMAQEASEYKFTKIREIPHTTVKDQAETGTCWCFATISFIESELIRTGHEEMDLSEMFVVKKAYQNKAGNYLRYHGKVNFSEGGQAHDVIEVIEEYGMVREELLTGLQPGQKEHDHGELVSVLSGYIEALQNQNTLSKLWMDGFSAILDVYLGKDPEKVLYEERELSPLEFYSQFELDPDDYVELTSYSHHPYYEPFVLEIPDNWSSGAYYNLPLDELLAVVDQALKNGYSVCWDGDTSERGFSHKKGLAIVQEGEDTSKIPVKEKAISQADRQRAFDNYSTTDDHLMHLVGTAEAKNGEQFYLVKNSWGTDGNDYGGKLFLSRPYLALHTVAIMVHKDAIPDEIRGKLML